MIKSKLTRVYSKNCKEVWDIVTNNDEYSWRSDLSRIVVESENKFIEYTKNNFPTYFTILKKEPYSIYQFNLKNKNFKGTWIGKFMELEDGNTEIEFIEELKIKNPLIEIIAKLTGIIQKMQQKYADDLEKHLNGK